MDDRGDAMRGDHAFHEVLVGRITDEQRHAFRQRGREAGGEIIDHDHARAGFHQSENGVAADVTGTAGDENGHKRFHHLLAARATALCDTMVSRKRAMEVLNLRLSWPFSWLFLRETALWFPNR